jgi:hypothetical protein
MTITELESWLVSELEHSEEPVTKPSPQHFVVQLE